MARSLDRRVTLVEGTERKVPLHFHWVGDELLPDTLEAGPVRMDVERHVVTVEGVEQRLHRALAAEILAGDEIHGALTVGRRDRGCDGPRDVPRAPQSEDRAASAKPPSISCPRRRAR